jgi:anti-sigma factor (TIGR02949 family)
MNDCGCDKAKEELEEFLHHELSDDEAKTVAEHLAHCVDCNHEHLIGLALTEKVRKACQEQAPSELRDRVINALN